jgi:predicted double-glycine peptidase
MQFDRVVLAAFLVQVMLPASPPRILYDSTPLVPFFGQSQRGCGAAALAMVAAYWSRRGAKIDAEVMDPEIVQQELYDRAKKGISGDSMVQYLNQHGFTASAVSAEYADLRQQLDHDHPVIVCLKPIERNRPLHFVVVVEYEERNGYILVNDSSKGPGIPIKLAAFEREWQATSHWALFASPK